MCIVMVQFDVGHLLEWTKHGVGHYMLKVYLVEATRQRNGLFSSGLIDKWKAFPNSGLQFKWGSGEEALRCNLALDHKMFPELFWARKRKQAGPFQGFCLKPIFKVFGTKGVGNYRQLLYPTIQTWPNLLLNPSLKIYNGLIKAQFQAQFFGTSINFLGDKNFEPGNFDFYWIKWYHSGIITWSYRGSVLLSSLKGVFNNVSRKYF